MSPGVPRALAVAALVAVAGTGIWMARAAPSHAPALGAGLAGVACPPGPRCLAVGSHTNPSDVERPLSASWIGRTWTVTGTHAPAGTAGSALEAVSCASSTACMAVGHREILSRGLSGSASEGTPLAEAWDGSRWRTVPVGAPPGAVDSALHGVACTGGTCVAVGDGETRTGAELTFAEVWDGARWRLVITPNPGSAEDSFLQSVACASPDDCTAVGHYEYEVRQLYVRSATLVERWDGARWRIERSPNPVGVQGIAFQGVDCPSSSRCVAVGWERSGGRFGALAAGWDGTVWSIQPTPSFTGSPDTELSAVACPREDACTAVGFSQRSGGAVMLALSWNGSAWADRDPPALAGAADTALNGVDCSAPDACVAVGTYRTRSLLQRAFGATMSESGWTVEALPESPPSG